MNRTVKIRMENGVFVISYIDKDGKKQEVLKENVVKARKYAEKILRG